MSGLGQLRNVGKATLKDFRLLGITTVEQLATQDADALYLQLYERTKQPQDPCVHDVFAATIHQAKTGEALDWWIFTARRKVREGDFGRFLLKRAEHPGDRAWSALTVAD